MNYAKRQLNNSDSSEEEVKKARRTFDEKKKINCLENLPNELFYEIFDYFEGCKLYETFSNLNARVQNLLTCSSLHLKIYLYSHPEELLQYRSTHIVTPNRHRIMSLSLNNYCDDDSIFTLFPLDSSFSHLESLELYDIKSNEIIPLLVSLMSLPRLFSLTIIRDGDLEEVIDVYQIIFSLPLIKYNKLSFFTFSTSIPLSIATNDQFSGIEYLVIDHCCALDELIVMLSYTPQLYRLICTQMNEPQRNIRKETLTTISNLTHISISRCYAEFDDLETFIMKISSQLQVLRITTCMDVTYLNADRWERIISQYLCHLHIFEFQHEETIAEDLDVTPYHALINRFNSPFWIKRKWVFRLYIDTGGWTDDVLVYSIFSHRKRSVNFHEYEENDGSSDSDADQNIKQHAIVDNERESAPSSMIFSETNQLTINYLPDVNNNESFIDIIGPILAIAQITCLNITRREIFIGTLINLIQCLPNLDSLVISSLAMMQPRCLSIDEARTLRVVSNNNKITKVNLQQMNDLAQAQFIINLCPRMQYFELDCASNIDPEWIVRFILMKNIKYIPNLCSLCLRISKTNEDIVEKLKQMINLEQLHHNYTIKEIDNRIYLRWTI